ncbi:hypothetical protein ILYODFUR_007269 [Ilyodon furcidens]|uniref:Uncharacterized protein n=1 Tax=Ilyodon furcidens TaxID=33524 RepID=A0ABV0SJ98_9TELE
MNKDGGKERRSGEKEATMETQRDSSGEEDTEEVKVSIHIILTPMKDDPCTGTSLANRPEVGCIKTEGDTNWLPDGNLLLLLEYNSSLKREELRIKEEDFRNEEDNKRLDEKEE